MSYILWVCHLAPGNGQVEQKARFEEDVRVKQKVEVEDGVYVEGGES